ncbi:antibiotic efflux protein [hydrothermal vent metagenome]|uniref:Antibiotic efflux protein n=1 Tax=hydrothermal vent metagenome TaxID=652676 RepID=A0A3B0S5H0_9ZZZZ
MSDPAIKEEKRKPRLDTNYWKLWTASVVSNVGDGIGTIAYPWIASSVTRNGLLIAGIAIAQRLPWLVFTLPAGVITDRFDRRKIMVLMDVIRAALIAIMAFIVFGRQDGLPTPDIIEKGLPFVEDLALYWVLLVGALLLGFAEVLRDNTSQTILPAIVDSDDLETANGRMWAAEVVSNSFIGPFVGAVLLGVALSLPLGFDAVSFLLAAVLVATMKGAFAPSRSAEAADGRPNWKDEIREGFRWLRAHTVLWPMAIILGILNAAFAGQTAVFVLWAQEILGADARVLAYLGTAGAVGGVVGSVLAKRIAARLGSGTALAFTLVAMGVLPAITGFLRDWWAVWLLIIIGSLAGMVWNVITVSLRQTIIPDDLLGRVNSVYRFFAWGMMPIGLLIGGLVMRTTEVLANRDLALRMPYFVSAVVLTLVAVWAIPKLTTKKLEAARTEGIAAREQREAHKRQTAQRGTTSDG